MFSALSLRVFHEDITIAGREAAAKQKSKLSSNVPSGVATPTTADPLQEQEDGMTVDAVQKVEATVAIDEAP